MAIKGSTVAERRAARRGRTRRNRVAYFAALVRQAQTGREQLRRVCDYALAAAGDLDDTGRRFLAQQIATLVDERTQQ